MGQLGLPFPYKPTNPHFAIGQLLVKLMREKGGVGKVRREIVGACVNGNSH